MKIYSNGRQNAFVNTCMVVASIAGVQVEEVITTEEERKAPEHIKKFGHTKCPALETPEGNVTESVAIAKFFARLAPQSNLLGTSSWEEAQVDQWLAFAHTSLLANAFNVLPAIMGYRSVDQETYNNATKGLRDSLKVAETQLTGREYLVGAGLTVADIAIAHFVQLLFQLVLETNQRKQFPNLVAWFERVSANEHYIKRNGKFHLCSKPAKAQIAVPEKPKKEVKKVEEEPAPKKEKEINPLDALPPSTFDMFAFKTYFFGEPDVNAALEKLHAEFDPAGYAWWYAEYEKYEGEGEVLYQTQNLMKGFIQRCDQFRKHAWAVMAIVGEEPKLDIVSVWMFRGLEIPQEMIDHPQFEYYKKRRLDATNAEDKALINEFFKNKKFEEGHTLMGRSLKDMKFHK